MLNDLSDTGADREIRELAKNLPPDFEVERNPFQFLKQFANGHTSGGRRTLFRLDQLARQFDDREREQSI